MERLIMDTKIRTELLLTKQNVRIQHLDAPLQSYVKNWHQTSLSTLIIFEKSVKKLNAQLIGIGGGN